MTEDVQKNERVHPVQSRLRLSLFRPHCLCVCGWWVARLPNNRLFAIFHTATVYIQETIVQPEYSNTPGILITLRGPEIRCAVSKSRETAIVFFLIPLWICKTSSPYQPFVIEILELVGSCDVFRKEIQAYNNYAQITPLSLYVQFVKHKTPTPCSCIDHHHHHHNDGGELGTK